jgi:hypothetical protein
VVEVALAALLADAAGDPLRDLAPLGDAVREALEDDRVLLGLPGALDEPGLDDLQSGGGGSEKGSKRARGQGKGEGRADVKAVCTTRFADGKR